MTIAFKDDFIDRIKEKGKAEGKEEGKAEGKAEMLLHILAARGFEVPERVRERVLGCTDPQQIYAWTDIAVTAASLEDVFQG
jgi:predicted transposase YdaD